jgi:hypothetical protein
MSPSSSDLPREAAHALLALLWSSGDEFDNAEASDELRKRVAADWLKFRAEAVALGFDAVEHRAVAIDRSQGDEWAYAAHDFILTRNRHGAGFWDGEWHEPWGQRLTQLSHNFPSIEIWLDGTTARSF